MTKEEFAEWLDEEIVRLEGIKRECGNEDDREGFMELHGCVYTAHNIRKEFEKITKY